jgi:hypothetical protein
LLPQLLPHSPLHLLPHSPLQLLPHSPLQLLPHSPLQLLPHSPLQLLPHSPLQLLPLIQQALVGNRFQFEPHNLRDHHHTYLPHRLQSERY